MIKVLFVDDEPAVLEGLENRLRHLNRRWDLRFASGGDEALNQLLDFPADVVVTDMRMPGMDGAQLMQRVRDDYPQAVRFVLSGEPTEKGAAKLVPVAHQMLTKPCDAAELERAIEHVCRFKARITRPEVQKVMGMLRSLPSLPRLYWDLVHELDRAEADSASVARIIEQDVAMTARVLQLANSAFFSAGRKVRNVRDAATVFGLHSLRSLVLSLGLCRSMSGVVAPRGFSLEGLQAHSLRTAHMAQSMLSDPELRKLAFSAGMLHAVGYLVLALGMPEEYSQARALAGERGISLYEAESEIFGCDHAEVGAQMLTLWGLPLPLSETVAYHHTPSASDEVRFGLIASVHVAAVLAEAPSPDGVIEHTLDMVFLDRIGAREVVEGWRSGKPIRSF